MKSKHKAQKVAEWMLKELKRQGKLHRDTAVYEIAEKFGSRSTTYDNKDGNLAIRIDILAAFRELTATGECARRATSRADTRLILR
jgi:hypothetical protein